LASATKDLNSQNRYMAKIEEGLAAEGAWWGPAAGNKLPAPGEFCATFTGRTDLMSNATRTANGTFVATDAGEGSGDYHRKIVYAGREIASLEQTKTGIQDLEKAYVVPQAE